jgi:hypothetical protein
LGYLPGAEATINERLKTSLQTTIASIQAAIPLVKENGLVSVTSYPGHDGGKEEAEAVEDLFSKFDPKEWRVYLHKAINRPTSPILSLAYKIGKS